MGTLNRHYGFRGSVYKTLNTQIRESEMFQVAVEGLIFKSLDLRSRTNRSGYCVRSVNETDQDTRSQCFPPTTESRRGFQRSRDFNTLICNLLSE